MECGRVRGGGPHPPGRGSGTIRPRHGATGGSTIHAMSARRLLRPIRATALFAALALPLAPAAPALAAAEFPAGDEGFHTYAEMRADIKAAADTHPDIVRVFSIGTSYEGRELWAAEVSDHVGIDEGEPEVLIDGLHHGLEHMSAELALASFHWLVDGYGTNARITDIVDGRRVWFVFMVNPDGGEFDIKGGRYHDWRRNRQPTPGSSWIGTDVNRNYDFRWGCCGGASHDPASSRYAGPTAFSTPEARAMRDLVESRIVDGRQRIRTHITFHTDGRLVMWPYGFTTADLPPQMTALDHDVFVTLGRAMAATNGYTPQQSSDLYISSGTFGSWMYGTQRVFSYVFELTRGDRPDDELIPKEARRNREAVLLLLEAADCPYRLVGRARAWCGPFADDLEIDRAWTVDPDGTDTATAGAWVRGVARAGTTQRGDAWSGQGQLVTGRSASVDVDGGVTTVRSPSFRLPDAPGSRLHLRAWAAFDASAGPDDGLEVRLVDAAGDPIGPLLVRVRGDGSVHAPTWRQYSVELPAAAAGRQVAIELRARDAIVDGDATVELGVDDVRVTAP